jgi:hypothetical protein
MPERDRYYRAFQIYEQKSAATAVVRALDFLDPVEGGRQATKTVQPERRI